MKKVFVLVLILEVVFSSSIFAELTIKVDENIRSSPNGQKIGILRKGTAVEEIKREGNWIKFKLEGWIWAPSVGLTTISTGKRKVKSSYREITVEEFLAFPEDYHGKKIIVKGRFGFHYPHLSDTNFYACCIRSKAGSHKVEIYINKKIQRNLVKIAITLKYNEKITVYGEGNYDIYGKGTIYVDDIKRGW